jgi:hypothetical protein
MTDDDFALEPYVLPPENNHPATIAARLMELPEHAHLKDHDVTFDYLLKCDTLVKGGKMVLGAVHEPNVQGKLRDLFLMLLQSFFGRIPHYLIVLDREFWLNEATPIQREALLYHELSHVKQATDKYGALKFDKDGNPVWALVEHDISAFNDEVARYGAWHEGIASFLAAAR